MRGKCKWTDNRLLNATKPIPPEKRRNVYVSYNRELPGLDQLNNLITINPFYQLPNLNKILIFTKNQQQNLSLPGELEAFCNNFGVKLKLFEKHSNVEKIMEYLYSKGKSNILVHENINYQKELYDLKTPESKQKTSNGKLINPLNLHHMPQEIVLLTQRLPL